MLMSQLKNMNKINWFFIQWVFLIVKPASALDITLMLQYLEYTGSYNITCVLSGKNLNSGIARILPAYNTKQNVQTHVSKYVPSSHEELNCNINDKEECTSKWTNKNWIIGDPFSINLDGVTDNRWDEFEIIYTNEDSQYKGIYHYIEHNNKLTIHFSIRIQDNADIFLCNSGNPLTSDCYWILLGVEHTKIRKCMKYEIGYYWDNPKSLCVIFRASIKTPNDEILSIGSWKHFTITINGRNIVLKLMATDFILLNYTDYDKEYISTDYLSVRSGSPAYWKFHEYKFTYTTNIANERLGPTINIQDYKFCISLYIAMCSKCSLIINALQVRQDHFHTVATNTVRPVKEFKWQEVKWNISLSTLSEISLQVQTQCDDYNSVGQFWAIDNFRICKENEVRVVNFEGSETLSSFQIVDSQFKNIDMKTIISQPRDKVSFLDPKCPIDTVESTTCARCSDIFDNNKEFCQGSIICDFSFNNEGICKCSPGYSGTFCQTPCLYPYYGSNCNKKCGLCENSTNCHFITGSCTSNKCTASFTDQQCKIPQYPILTNVPIVTGRGNTYIKIKITNFAYYGLGIPARFKIIYELTGYNNSSIETGSYSFYYPHEITLYDLQSDTSYTIRIVLVTLQNQLYDGIYVRRIIVNTTCTDIQKEDIIINTPTNSSAVVTFRDMPGLCPLKYYAIYYINLYDNSTRHINFKTNNQFSIQNLLPYADYTLTIKNKITGSKISYTFKTKEGVPSGVSYINYSSPSATSLLISWGQPLQSNKQIAYYEINYKHNKYLACDSNDISNDSTVHLTHSSTSILLNDLIPYSEYIIQIAAVTVVVGQFSEIRGFTSETDVLDESEFPTRVNVKPSSTEVVIKIEQAKCSLVKGEIDYYISARCTNNWCLNNRISTLNTSYPFARQRVILSELLPYSMYTMSVEMRRKNGNMPTKQLSPITFTTLSTAPNAFKFEIYEKSKNMFRLRIAPPYPPTGELEKYKVQYCELTKQNYCLDTSYFDVVPENCKIWPEYHCIDISENLKQETLYIVYVVAVNKNISKLSDESSATIKTEQGRSNAPEHLNYSWDNYYNLTVQWNHPNVTNGPLTKFEIKVFKYQTPCYTYNYMVNESTTTLTYNYMVIMENETCYTSKLSIQIQSFNIMPGNSIRLDNIYSPPETPSLSNQPFIESVSNTTITLALSAKKSVLSGLSKSFLYIILSESESKLEINSVADLSKLENLKTLLFLIGKYNLKTEVPMEKITIGSNETNNLSQNVDNNTIITLNQNTSYTITIVMYNEYQNITRYRLYEIVTSTLGVRISPNSNYYKNYSSNNALFSLILLFLIPILLWIYIRYYRGYSTEKWCSIKTPNIPFIFKAKVRSNPDVIPLEESVNISLNSTSNNLNDVKDNDDITDSKFSNPIKITDYTEYVKDAIITGELARQHSLFPRGQTKPWDYGILAQNKSKNRYNNLIAYDHTRVELEKIDDDPYSDYINANYIDGYKFKNAYIATQGPKVSTVNDFWRMIWQEKAKYIVMLANVIEDGKKKTEQYWPNMNRTSQFGNVSVTYVSTVVFADYEHRTFVVTSNNIERQIEHLHFTSWPDHGVPMYSQSLVPLLRKLLSISQENSPIIIHCSAGVGRTGTVILCDICLRMSAHEGILDVLKYQYKIREQRANLVDNLEQYKLVHLVLLECLINPNTSITCNAGAEKNILHVLETDELEKQFRHISEIAWQDQAMRPSVVVNQNPEWKQKNRFENIIAGGYGQIYLSFFSTTDEQSDYINAVEVDGFNARRKFIATQQPLPNTISDFWRMIDEKNVFTIVSLNSINKENDSSCVFWPTSEINEIQPVPYLLIKFVNENHNEEITTIKLELYNKENEDSTKRDIDLIQLKGWPDGQLIPNSNVCLLKLLDEVEKGYKTKHPIVVTCYDGVTACGLFIAFTFLIEKIKLEHECDVCLAVRTVRRNRNQFVQDLDQFRYLYRAAITYITSFKTYANFSSAINNSNIYCQIE